ncbi:hypothetical protein HDU98_004844 [Podochytrium sp. JEL0797]|nr:hypothetical protein HDU98_004844 [Podochytrium sp. JEL0797]
MSFLNTVSPACGYALQSDIMTSDSCGQADVGHPFNATRANICVCNEMDPASVWAYCAGDDQKNWLDMYNSDVHELTQSCAAANLTVPTHSLLPLPSGMHAPTVSHAAPTSTSTAAATTGTASSVSPACAYAIFNDVQTIDSCGQGPNTNAINSCLCTLLNPESIWAYCAADNQANWIASYNTDYHARIKACAIAAILVPSQTLIPLPSGTSAPTVSLPAPDSATASTATSATLAASNTAASTATGSASGLPWTSPPSQTTNLYSSAMEASVSLIGAVAIAALVF